MWWHCGHIWNIQLKYFSSYALSNKIQDGGRPPSWIISSTLLQSHYNAFRCADILTKFGICSWNTFEIMPLQKVFKLATVSHLELCFTSYCKALTMALKELTLWPNLENVAQILFKFRHFKWNLRWRPSAILDYTEHPNAKVFTVPLHVLTLWPNLEYVAQILFKLCHFK